MPLTYRIDSARGLVTITGDYAEAADWRALLEAVARDPGYRSGFSFLRDLRASVRPVDAQTVVGIMAVVQEFWRVLGARRAGIVIRLRIDDPAMIAHALAEDQRIPLRAFTAYDEAVAWLMEK